MSAAGFFRVCGARQRSAFVLMSVSPSCRSSRARSALPQATDALQVLQQLLRHRRICRWRRRPVEHRDRHDQHEHSVGAHDCGAERRRGAGRVSVLAGRDLRRSQCRGHSRRRDVQRRAAQHSSRLGTFHRPPWAWGATTRVRSMAETAAEGLHVPRRCPAVSGRRPAERPARHQQGWAAIPSRCRTTARPERSARAWS